MKCIRPDTQHKPNHFDNKKTTTNTKETNSNILFFLSLFFFFFILLSRAKLKLKQKQKSQTHSARKVLENRSLADEERMDALENQLKEARFLAEEADKKYDEVLLRVT